MHRPQKKKKDADPAQESDKPDVDERHLVGLDDAVEMSLEDRMVVYWSENKQFILGCITVLLLVVVGYQGLRIFSAFSRQQIGNDYNLAQVEGSLAAFAGDHGGKPLGGFAALQAADEAFQTDDFSTALDQYARAAKALRGTELEGRALIGEAFARIRSGDREAGISALQAIIDNRELGSSVRGQAGYHLAVDAYSKGDSEGFDRYYAQVEGTPAGAAWTQRLDYLRDRME